MARRRLAARRFRFLITLMSLVAPSAVFAVTVVVTSTADVVTICATTGQSSSGGGPGCTLRDAITYSNANPQPQAFANLIHFNIPGGGVQTIGLGSFGSGIPLPAITTGTTIDGYSQPGASANTLAVGDNAVLLIQLHGDPPGGPLLHVSGGTGTLVKGLILSGQEQVDYPFTAPSAIVLDSPFNVVAGNFIGIAPNGLSFDSSTVGDVIVNSNVNLIGGSTPADRNLLGAARSNSFDVDGIAIAGSGNDVKGNYIGTNRAGFLLPPSGPNGCLGVAGIGVTGDDNFIGGSPAERNVIAGYCQGIIFEGGGSFANLVQGNFIGTDATGGNGAGEMAQGILIVDASENFVGALTAGNRIAYSQFDGVHLAGSSQGNTICCNSIFSNDQFALVPASLGIDLDLGQTVEGDGVTPNDPCDADAGPNGLQNFPVLTQASSDPFVTNIVGSLNSLPNTAFRIQFFSNASCNPSGFGEGESFIGETFVTTNANCDASFNVFLLAGGLGGKFVTSTATNLSTGDTSEFSACLQSVGTQGTKVNGTIQSVNIDNRSFVLTTASGAVTVLTDEMTKFRKNHKTVDFSALAVGDLAVVKGARQSDGSILAKKVTVGGQEQDEVE